MSSIVTDNATGLKAISPAPTAGTVAAMVQDNFAKLSTDKLDASRINQPNGVAGIGSDGVIVGTFAVRRGTAAAMASVVLANGEFGVTTDTRVLKLGDGDAAFASLAAINATAGAAYVEIEAPTSGTAATATLAQDTTLILNATNANVTVGTPNVLLNVVKPAASGIRATVILRMRSYGTATVTLGTSAIAIANGSTRRSSFSLGWSLGVAAFDSTTSPRYLVLKLVSINHSITGTPNLAWLIERADPEFVIEPVEE